VAEKGVARSIGVGAGKFLGMRRMFAQISPNLPEKNSKKKRSSKKTAFHFILGDFFSNHAHQTHPPPTLLAKRWQRVPFNTLVF